MAFLDKDDNAALLGKEDFQKALRGLTKCVLRAQPTPPRMALLAVRQHLVADSVRRRPGGRDGAVSVALGSLWGQNSHGGLRRLRQGHCGVHDAVQLTQL